MYRKLAHCLVSSGVTCAHRRLLSTQFKLLLGDKFSALPRVTTVTPHHINTYCTSNGKQVEVNAAAEPDVLYSNVDVEVMSHDPSVLNSYEFFATEAAKLLDIPCESETPPKIIDRRTLLKSRHVHGKYHKVQYETRTHFKLIKLSKLTGSTADTYLEYIQRNLPEGMAMKVTKTRLEKFPEHIKRPETASGAGS